jgi:hypothetical protein
MRLVGALIVLSCSLYFWKGLAEQIALRVWGLETTATVVHVRQTSYGRRPAYEAFYKFTTEDQTIAHGTCASHRGAEGGGLKILYLRANPEINEPDKLWYGVLWMIFFGGVGGLFTLWAARILLRVRKPGAEDDDDADLDDAEDEDRAEDKMPKTEARLPADKESEEASILDAPIPNWRNSWRIAFFAATALGACLTAIWLILLESGAMAAAAGQTTEDLGALEADEPLKAAAAETAFGRGSTVGNAANDDILGFDQEWVYFDVWREYNLPNAAPPGLYRCRQSDGSGWAMVGKPGQTEKIFRGICVYDGWAYYLDMGGICRIRTDGSKHQVLLEKKVSSFCFADGWIYYQIKYDNDRLYRMKPDGGAQTRVTQEEVGCWTVGADGHIYYANKTDHEKIYRVRYDGSGRRKLSDQTARKLSAEAGTLWFIDGASGHLRRMNTAGENVETVVEDKVTSLNVFGGWVFFTRDGIINRCKPDGSEMEPITKDGATHQFCVFNNRVYSRVGESGSGAIRSFDLDGGQPKSFDR